MNWTTTRPANLPKPTPTGQTRHQLVSRRLAPGVVGCMLAAYLMAGLTYWLNGTHGLLLGLTVFGAAGCVALLGLFRRGKLDVAQAISWLSVVDISYIIVKFFYLAFVVPDQQMLLYALSSDFLWTACTPTLAYSVPITPLARQFVRAQPVAFTVLSALYLLLHHPADPRLVFSLVQVCFVNWAALVLAQRFSVTLVRLLRARKDNETLTRLAYHDELTGLLNRRGLEERLKEMLAQSRATRTSVAVIFLDLDGFKPINDTLGHQVGDELLQSVARRIGRLTAGWAEGARVAGDEFVVVALVNDPVHLERDARDFHAALSQPVMVQGKRVELTISAGLSLYPQDAQTAQDALRRADIAMLSAKTSGKNKIRLYGRNLHAEGEYRQAVTHELVGITGRNELKLLYQPIYDIRTGQVASCEALLRWSHPKLGNISPAVFIPLAESNGSILPIGLWVIRQALGSAARWRAQGLPGVRVAVNISPIQLIQPDFVMQVRRELEAAGLDGRALELEITEGLALTDRQATIELLLELRKLDILLSLDDFGEGFASLSHMRDLPVQHIKLDRSFLSSVDEEDPGSVRYNRALIQASLQLAEALQMEVIAEGVETPAQLQLLRDLGCHYAQGYLYTRPLAFGELIEHLGFRRS